jgi:3-hydroxyacyl-CoA dehydrogenase
MILQNYRDGLLLVEDINKYTSDNMKMDLIGSLATIRQAGIDLIAHYQLVGKAGNPKLLGMTNYIRLHKTNDSVKRHKNKFEDKVPILSIAENIVEKRYKYGMENKVKDNTGEFFSLWVDMEYGKIKGAFTKEEADQAINEYISDEYNYTIAPLLRKRDENGRKVFKTYKEAYAYLKDSMRKNYFCFN